MAALARLCLLFNLFVFAFAFHHHHLAARTAPEDDGYATTGWTPKPTERPLVKGLFGRQNNTLQAGFPSSICGYVSSNANFPYACDEGNYCGIATELGYFGCCSTYSPSTFGNTVSYILSNCSWFQTRCWDSTAGAQANYTNYLEQWCGDAAYPFCETYTSFNGNATLVDCWTKPGTYLLSNPIPAASMPLIPDAAITAAELSWEKSIATTSSSTNPTSTISPGTVVGTLPGTSSSTQPTSTTSVSPSASSLAVTPSSSSGAAPAASSPSSSAGVQSAGGGLGMIAASLLNIACMLIFLVDGYL